MLLPPPPNGINAQKNEALLRFRRGLRRDDQAVFDEFIEDIRPYLAAIGQAPENSTLEAILMTLLLLHRKEIKRLAAKIELMERERKARDDFEGA